MKSFDERARWNFHGNRSSKNRPRDRSVKKIARGAFKGCELGILRQSSIIDRADLALAGDSSPIRDLSIERSKCTMQSCPRADKTFPSARAWERIDNATRLAF